MSRKYGALTYPRPLGPPWLKQGVSNANWHIKRLEIHIAIFLAGGE